MKIAEIAKLSLSLALALALAGAAGAEGDRAPRRGPGGPGGPGGPPGDRLERLVEGIDLDAETLAVVDALIDDARTLQRQLRRDLRAAHGRMRGLLEAPEPDESAILGQADTIGQLETELSKSRLRTLLRVRAALPEDARARLLERMKERRPGPPGRMQERRPGPPGRERRGPPDPQSVGP